MEDKVVFGLEILGTNRVIFGAITFPFGANTVVFGAKILAVQ